MKLTIGRLAQQTGVTIETIRYYQRKGLLKEPKKPVSGFRHYPDDTHARIHFIKRAQRFGFTLREISELLALDSGHCEDVRKLAEQKYRQIGEQIRDLTALYHALDKLVKGCHAKSSAHSCSLIESLSGSPALPDSDKLPGAAFEDQG